MPAPWKQRRSWRFSEENPPIIFSDLPTDQRGLDEVQRIKLEQGVLEHAQIQLYRTQPVLKAALHSHQLPFACWKSWRMPNSRIFSTPGCRQTASRFGPGPARTLPGSLRQGLAGVRSRRPLHRLLPQRASNGRRGRRGEPGEKLIRPRAGAGLLEIGRRLSYKIRCLFYESIPRRPEVAGARSFFGVLTCQFTSTYAASADTSSRRCKNERRAADAICPACENDSLKKKISAPGFRLSGSGWYETDFKSDNQKNIAKGDIRRQAAETGKSDSAKKKDRPSPAAKRPPPEIPGPAACRTPVFNHSTNSEPVICARIIVVNSTGHIGRISRSACAAGSIAAAIMAVSSSSTCATRRACCRWSSIPTTRAMFADAETLRNEFVIRVEGLLRYAPRVPRIRKWRPVKSNCWRARWTS